MRSIKFAKHKILIIPLGLVAITLLSGYFLSHFTITSSAHAETSQASVTVASACSMIGNIASGEEHTKTITPGGYEEGIGKTTLKTICNDTNGYSIYAVGYSGGTLDNTTNDTYGNTNMVGITTNLTIPTGVWDGTSDTSMWAMKLTKVTNQSGAANITYNPDNLSIINSYDNYHAVPSEYTKVAEYTSSTDSTLGSLVETTYAAKVSLSQAADTYVGKVRYTMVHPNTNVDTGTPFDIAFLMAGKERDTATGLYKMQDMTPAICNSVSMPTDATAATTQETKLVDIRDGKTYWVAKLLDGNCWMTQNLDFDITGPLDSTTTNLTVAGEAPYTDGYVKDPSTNIITWTPASTAVTIHTGRDKTGPDGEINYGTNAGKWANSNNAPYSVDPGEWYQTGTYFASSVCNDKSWSTGCNFLNSAKNTAQDGVTALTTYFRQTPYADNGTHGAIGNWYNWNAAVAANDTSALSTGGITVNNSVCPAGWGLPANGKYEIVNTNYNSGAISGSLDAGLFAAPLYLVRGGFIYTNGSPAVSTLYDAGRFGYYWSSTTYSDTNGYNLSFRSANVKPDNNYYRGDGFSVRCLLRTE